MSYLFISHSSRDKERAEKLFAHLAACGYRMFLDSEPESGIKAGQEWEKELHRNLNQASAVVVLCSDNLLASRWCFFEIASARALGKPIFPVIVSPCEVLDLLKDRQVVDLAAEGEHALDKLLLGMRTAGLDPNDSLAWDPHRAPYPGLNFFAAEDAGVFFGRDDEVREVLEALETMRRRGTPRLALVLGASGSGKSSLMRAGVLPRLEKDSARGVVVPPFRPGAEPIGELARSLARVFPDDAGRPDWKDVRDRLQAAAKQEQPPSPDPLAELAVDLTQALGRHEAAVLLAIDQGEEALTGDDGASASFLRLVRRAVEAPGSSLFALFTLRSDYLGVFQNHPAHNGLKFTYLPLGPLAVESLPRVIEGPARRAEIELEDGLVAAMVNDTRTNDALPLLAFTLRAMYDRTANPRRFTHALYRDDLDGIQGAVAVVVKQIKEKVSFEPGSAAEADLRRAFLNLVRLDPEGNYVRKPAHWDALPEGSRPVLQEMIDARLLASKGEGVGRTVEVVHESLFRVWDDLNRWLAEKRELLLWRQNLQDELASWKANGKSPEYLLSGGRVAEARRMLAADREEFEPDEVRFVEASISEEDRKAEERRRLFRNVRLAAVAAGVFAVLATIGSGIAVDQRNLANKQLGIAEEKTKAAQEAEIKEKEQRTIAETEKKRALAGEQTAESRRLAALSEAVRPQRLDRALLLAVEAMRGDAAEARLALQHALDDRRDVTLLHHLPGSTSEVLFNSDGRLAVRSGPEVRVFDEKGRCVRMLELDYRNRKETLSSLALGPGGVIAMGYVVIGSDRGEVAVFDAEGRRSRTLKVEEGEVGHVIYAPGGGLAAVYRGRKNERDGVAVSDAEGVLSRTHKVEEGTLKDVAYSPDGILAVASDSNGVSLFDVEGRLVRNLVVSQGEVDCVGRVDCLEADPVMV